MNTTPVKIDRARWWALSNADAVFYGSLATNLRDVMSDAVETAATDGQRILWSPAFVESLTEEETRFVLLHETLHCAHDHFCRLPLNERGNMAGDYAINAILAKIPGLSMPKGGLLDAKFAGMAEEEILARLPNPPPNGGKGGKGGKGGDPGKCGQFIEPAKESDGQTLREKWEQAVLQAEFVAKALGQGQVPADMSRILERVRAVEVDWRKEMAEFLRSLLSDRADWSRSTRRMACEPVIYPRRKRDNFGTVVAIRDTSGSIDNALCADFSAQVSAFCADMRCNAVVIDCDAKVQAEHRLEPGDLCPLTAKGGGGTDFRPAFARVAELLDEGETVAGVVYLTDLDGKFPAAPPDVPTLWAAYNTKATAPFGRTLFVSNP